jgi:hypothetical protein
MFSLMSSWGLAWARHGGATRKKQKDAASGSPQPTQTHAGATGSVNGCAQPLPFLLLLFAFPSYPGTSPSCLIASVFQQPSAGLGPGIYCWQVTALLEPLHCPGILFTHSLLHAPVSVK